MFRSNGAKLPGDSVDILGQLIAGFLAGGENAVNNGLVAGPVQHQRPECPRHGSSGATSSFHLLEVRQQWA